MKLLAGICCFILTCPLHAQVQYQERAPTTGPWKDQPPGTFVVTKHVLRDSKDAPPRVELQRELVLGTDDHAKPWFAVYKSDSPTGPWQYSFGHGGGTTYEDNPRSKSSPAGEKPLTIGDKTIACDATKFEMNDDSTIYTGEVWRHRATGIEVQQSRTSRPRDADSKP